MKSPRKASEQPTRETLLAQLAERDRELAAARERQAASSEVLRAISETRGDAGQSLRRIAEISARLFGAPSVSIQLADGEELITEYRVGAIAKRVGSANPRSAIRVGGRNLPGTVVAQCRQIHIPDLDHLEPSMADFPGLPHARAGGARTICGTPLRRGDKAIGALIVFRDELSPFTEEELALQQGFADQAAIAVENARLFNETQEALKQQTATADVLQVISRSAFNLQTVLDTLVESAAHLCEADMASINRQSAEGFRQVASHGYSQEFNAYMVDHRPPEGAGSIAGRAMASLAPTQIADVLADPDYNFKEGARIGGTRTMLAVPLVREGAPMGVVVLSRKAVKTFTDRQIGLVRTFADQAVIAIENARLFDEVRARTREVTEALERQTATNEILSVISRSPSDLMPVLETISNTASRLCGSEQTIFFRFDGEVFRFLASWNFPPEVREMLERRPIYPGHPSALGRAGATLKPVYIPDVLADPDYGLGGERKAAGYRTSLAVPLLREGKLIGALSLNRSEPGAFTEKHAEIVGTFADQAVIAIENARLFEEVQAKTRDLSEALVYQTGSANILKAIASSPTEVAPTLQAIVDSACEVCGANDAAVILREGDIGRFAAHRGSIPIGENTRALNRDWIGGRAILDQVPIHVPDLLAAGDEYPVGRDMALRMGHRTILAVPLLRDGESVGAIVVRRDEALAFTDKQIELLRSFADQAVIAIGNTRLFDEVQARTRDLTEALQQQTATADVLKVISRSAFELQPVLDTLIGTAVALCGAVNGTICLRDGEGYRYRASSGIAGDWSTFLNTHPPKSGRSSLAGRVILSGRVESVPDVLADPEYDLPISTMNKTRSVLGVPLLRDERLEGALLLARAEPGPFAPRQIELVQTFADQAVIAIENVRLFDEVQARTRELAEALRRQTATSDVLRAIAASPGNVRPVLDQLVETVCVLCEASDAVIMLRDGEELWTPAHHGPIPVPPNAGRRLISRDWPPGRAVAEGRTIHVHDLESARDEYPLAIAISADVALEASRSAPSPGLAWRTVVAAPLMREGEALGAIVLRRVDISPFSDSQVALLETFADQAVIAVENARLFDEVQARTRELAASLDDLRKAQDRLVQSEKLASLGQLTAGIAHEIKNPLNFVNNFSALSRELLDELRDVLVKAPLDAGQRDATDELIGMLDSNLDKVVNHGKRADSIVKNMLLHSRDGSGVRSTTNVNAMVEEALNLAYHGARAEKPGFDATIVKLLDSKAGEAELYGQEITRVLLNLISNGFYATTKRGQDDPTHEPTITAYTRDLGDFVEIAIRDNGLGISEEVRAKMFNPFFTTKPAGEGTGLGLSLSHDIIVKQHGGGIEVATEFGAFTQFTLRLPRKGTS